jgi:3-oxo-4,17-pregnadiene-20-carboxyl-CoA hydratase beta subunit
VTATTEQRLTEEEINAKLAEFVGRTDLGSAIHAREPISTTTIRQLTDALGDRNPVYTDPEFAAKSIHGEIVVPPTALQVFSLPGLPPKPGRHLVGPDGVQRFVLAPGGQHIPGDSSDRVMLDELHDLLEAAGYTSPAVTNGWYEYKRYLRPGDHLSFSAPSVDEFFGPKQTALGKGYFITMSQDVTDQHGELVAIMKHRFIRFKPAFEEGATEMPSSPPWKAPTEELGDYTIAPGPRLTTLRHSEVHVGDELPKLVIELTPTLIVATAIATQDYQNVHHDRDAVQRLGHPDVFMNILTSTGFVGRFITDWAGPEAVIEAATVKLGVPNYPYGDYTLSGKVIEHDAAGDRGRVVVDVKGTNTIGTHFSGQVTLTLPL